MQKHHYYQHCNQTIIFKLIGRPQKVAHGERHIGRTDSQTPIAAQTAGIPARTCASRMLQHRTILTCMLTPIQHHAHLPGAIRIHETKHLEPCNILFEIMNSKRTRSEGAGQRVHSRASFLNLRSERNMTSTARMP